MGSHNGSRSPTRAVGERRVGVEDRREREQRGQEQHLSDEDLSRGGRLECLDGVIHGDALVSATPR
jgi:hypothetical protein